MDTSQPQTGTSKQIAWIVLIVVVLALAVGGYFMLNGNSGNANNGNSVANTATNLASNTNAASNSNSLANDNSNTAQNTNNLNSSINTNTNIDTSGWETYRNDAVGISFNYPADWDQTYYTESVRAEYYQDSIFAARQSYDTESASPGYGEIVVRSIPNPDTLSLNDWVRVNDPVTDAETLVFEDSTTVDGENAFYRRATSNVAGGVLDTRYVLHGNSVIALETNSRISSDHEASQSQFDADAQTFLDSVTLF